jgi:hypothetical protein
VQRVSPIGMMSVATPGGGPKSGTIVRRMPVVLGKGMSVQKKHLTTMDDIARLANVSKPTVSRAFKDSPLVKPETKDRILAIARRHGYAVNSNAQKLRTNRTRTVAVVMPEVCGCAVMIFYCAPPRPMMPMRTRS